MWITNLRKGGGHSAATSYASPPQGVIYASAGEFATEKAMLH